MVHKASSSSSGLLLALEAFSSPRPKEFFNPIYCSSGATNLLFVVCLFASDCSTCLCLSLSWQQQAMQNADDERRAKIQNFCRSSKREREREKNTKVQTFAADTQFKLFVVEFEIRAANFYITIVERVQAQPALAALDFSECAHAHSLTDPSQV